MSRERLYSYSTTSTQSDGLDHSSHDNNVQRNQSIEGMLANSLVAWLNVFLSRCFASDACGK
jgi:hypothetical protein